MGIPASFGRILYAICHLVASIFYRAYTSLLNGRCLPFLVLNFAKNFGIIFTWLLIFKNAGLIPTDIRPPINVTILHRVDSFVFDGSSGLVCGIIMTCIVWAVAYYLSNDVNELYAEYRRNDNGTHLFGEKRPSSDLDHSTELDITLGYAEEDFSLDDSADDESVGSGDSEGSISTVGHSNGPRYKLADLVSSNFVNITIVSLIWLYLNIEKLAARDLTTAKDITAWLSYVILHLAAPIITACYLWLFNPPGVCGTFGLALGTQNILGVCTHLLMPTAPPWYNHKFGDQPGTYDMPGYAAGLTRVDLALGTHIHSQGFHKSPIVFGAFPSLHSAFVCLIFLFISRYARWGVRPVPVGTAVAALYASWQWWATIYLDHHWRLDLIGGAIYAVISYMIFLPRLRRFETEFVVGGDAVTTGGMRLFANSFLENWFNPTKNSDMFGRFRRGGYQQAGSQVTLTLEDFDL